MRPVALHRGSFSCCMLRFQCKYCASKAPASTRTIGYADLPCSPRPGAAGAAARDGREAPRLVC